MTPRILIGIPVYNEERYVTSVLREVRRYAADILVIDDGSRDRTPMMLAEQPVEVIRHATNRGYGRSMQDMIRWARFDGFDWLITMDCDEQHEPAAIPRFIEAIRADDADVISGSRYLEARVGDDAPPQDRRTQVIGIEDGLGHVGHAGGAGPDHDPEGARDRDDPALGQSVEVGDEPTAVVGGRIG